MAAAMLRSGKELCVRCIQRELCRVVWRPHAALYSSKPSDTKQLRRTHIRKAKPQPAVDVAKLLEQIFSQQRPGTAPPAGKVRPAKASSVFAKPPPTSSVKVSTSQTEPAVSVFPAASSLKHVVADTSSGSSQTSTETAAIECQPPAETVETKVETAAEPAELTEQPSSLYMEEKNADTSPFPAATVETAIESPVEPILSPAETLEIKAAVVEGPVESTVDVPAEETQASGVVSVTHTSKEQPLVETAIESQIEASHLPLETLEARAAAVEGPVEPTVDVAAQKVETKCTDSGVVDILHTTTVEPTVETVELSVEAITSQALEPTVDATVEAPAQVEETNNLSHTAAEEPLIETTIDASVESSTSLMETLDSRAAVAESSVETIEVEAETAAELAHTSSTDHAYAAKEEPLIETTINASVESSTPPTETLESRAAETIEAEAETAAQFAHKEEPLRETAIESPVEANLIPVETLETGAEAVEGPVDVTVDETTSTESGVIITSCISKEEPSIEAAVEASSSSVSNNIASIQNAQESAALPLKHEPTEESEEGVNRSEEMTLESVTLLEDEILVASLKDDELLQTKSILEEKAEKQLQELLAQTETGVENEAAAETESSSEDEGEILTEVLSKWDSLSEDLQELEGESGVLVKELLCHAPAVLSKPPGTSSADPPAGASGESLQVEKVTEAESMTLESITLANVKAEVRGFETEDLQETRNALEKEADGLAEKEKMEVTPMEEDVAVFEDTAEAEILTLDFISEATDAIEAETSVMLEAMFGSEQGLRQPLQNPEQFLEAGKETGAQQEVSVLEAMSLESVTLAEVEASLGTLESLSETADFLETEAEVVVGEKMEVEEAAASEETAETLELESLSEDLQIDALMEELLFSEHGHVTGGPSGQESLRADVSDETVLTASVDIDAATAVSDDCLASPALKEELLEEVEKEEEEKQEEEGAQAEALGNEDGSGTHADLDPVQRLFLEKMREYKNMRRLNVGLLEAEPDYEKYLLDETAKLQRLYGGGDLSSFPQFTFTDPEMDQDSK